MVCEYLSNWANTLGIQTSELQFFTASVLSVFQKFTSFIYCSLLQVRHILCLETSQLDQTLFDPLHICVLLQLRFGGQNKLNKYAGTYLTTSPASAQTLLILWILQIDSVFSPLTSLFPGLNPSSYSAIRHHHLNQWPSLLVAATSLISHLAAPSSCLILTCGHHIQVCISSWL